MFGILLFYFRRINKELHILNYTQKDVTIINNSMRNGHKYADKTRHDRNCNFIKSQPDLIE
jgi:hypothetical protein